MIKNFLRCSFCLDNNFGRYYRVGNFTNNGIFGAAWLNDWLKINESGSTVHPTLGGKRRKYDDFFWVLTNKIKGWYKGTVTQVGVSAVEYYQSLKT